MNISNICSLHVVQRRPGVGNCVNHYLFVTMCQFSRLQKKTVGQTLHCLDRIEEGGIA